MTSEQENEESLAGAAAPVEPVLAELIFDSMEFGVAVLDGEGRYISANKHWYTLLGLDEAEPIEGVSHFKVCQSFLFPGDLRTLASGQAITHQLVDVRVRDDESNVLRWRAHPLKRDDANCCEGDACYVVALTRYDLPESDSRRLLRERDQLRFALDGADFGLWDWNVVTGEVYFSRQYMNMLGYEQFELPHAYSTWNLFCKPEEVIDYQDAIDDYVAAGEGFLEDVFQMRHKDGHYIWILSRGKIISRRPDGSPLRIVGTHQDVTTSKEREEQLVIARDEAHKANQAKSNFLALISHEVRTPLNAITSVLQLLGDEADEAERKRLSQVALNSSDQLLRVLSDVLDVSKMEAGRFDLNPRPVAIADLIEELSQTHKKAIEGKGLAFFVTVNGDPDLHLMMDAVRVTQVLNNYLSNATKFTEAGEVSLTVDIDVPECSDDARQFFVSFAVRDDGVGLTPSEREKLFQPFYQAEGTRNRSSEGTGLGLSICKSLAGMMGGKVWCASKKGRGSTFYFEAGFERAEAADVDTPEISEALSGADAKVIRILAAEDNPVNQMMLRKFLSDRFGHDLTVVSDGVEALAALEKGEFDIVLMDVHMPVMDGVTAAKRIRNAKQTWSDIPIIALTADAADAHVAEYHEVGMNECSPKPVDWPLLDKRVRALANA